MSDQGPARTEFASAALQMTTTFAMRFKDTKVGEKAPRRVLVQEMDVETTGGGKQARVTITLVPEGGQGAGGRPLVCGWIDVAENRVQLRSYATVAALFKTQNKRFFDCPEADYQKFVEVTRAFVEENNHRFDVVDEVTPDSRPLSAAVAPAPVASGGSTLILAIGAVVIIGCVLALVLLLS